ncbi:RIP metalloprotease RseP [Noviherbaspirillum suwonense]|jgi:regulator of sigma E protease|uniref:Zinc metalloprotease n=1 Tax=Noviherbaspirillum suwonense TaxID=1224511 RepID=A0ABY1PWU7_9BURK|nr:RIP metalloprotease RseP [Noviherbaspirillum suwonense]SMP47569.1 regulator of sigma E protease [Noviherbaspirillum suwonense]
MMLLQTLLAFIVVLGVLVVVHELGHYWVARWCNVKVLRFSVGMGKIVWSRRFGPDQTEWAVSLLPLGGYVKMLDAREGNMADVSAADLKREYTVQSVWKRIAIVAAGPLANFILAILVFAGLFMHGIPEPAPRLRAVPQNSAAYDAGLRGGELVTAVNGEPVQLWSDLRWTLLQSAVNRAPARIDVERPDPSAAGGVSRFSATLPTNTLSASELETDFMPRLGIDLARPPATLGALTPDGPAARAGLRSGDLIRAIDGKPVTDGGMFVDMIKAAPGKALVVSVQRDGQPLDITVVPQRVEASGGATGRIQAEVAMSPEMVTASAPPLTAIARGAQKTWDTSVMTLRMLGRMLIGEASLKNITGPITIADYAGQTARIGWVSYLSFIAFISISLGVMNLLPIPVLDGGLLLYYSLEVLTGRPVPPRFGELAQRAGIGILMTLMMVAVFNDIVRLIS